MRAWGWRLAGLALLAAAPAFPADIPPEDQLPVRERPDFILLLSADELKATETWAKAQLKKARDAGHPVEPRVARTPSTVFISLESVTLCNSVIGCPLLVFRDIDKAPILTVDSYQSFMIEYRKDGTYLLPKRDDGKPAEECLISTATKARCKPMKPKKKD